MSNDNVNETFSDKKMSLTGHLAELRTCLIVSVVAVVAGFVISFYFSEDLLKILTDLISSEHKHSFVFLSPAEALWTNFKVAFLAGFFIAMPVILYQLWRFASPGLYGNERKYALPFLIVGIVSFVLGVLFCYFVILRYALEFLFTYKTSNLTPMISIGSYLDFVMKFMLAFGLIFELPIVIIFLTKTGILTIGFLTKNRKYAILVNFIVAAVLTPTPDVFNQLLMAVPLIILYELGIIGAKIFCKNAKTRNSLSLD
ncbi:MAG: twin-arginine translocase subunit TatC [Nitrospirae bacterium]|nr:twin-arginine translocase subunit TatC [Nitrospirota bacterium]